MFLKVLSGKGPRFCVSALCVLALSLCLCGTPADAKTKEHHKKTTRSATKKATRSTAKRSAKKGKRRHVGAPVSRDARYSDIVIDAKTGQILHDVASDRVRHPASLTKMMTLYLTFQALETGRLTMDQRLVVSAKAASQSPSKLGLRAGQSIRVQDAILAVVTLSANDMAVTLAEAIGGNTDRFAQLMTAQARALGMKQTSFQNPSGLPDPDQVTSARDMAVLGYALINHYPQFYPFFSHETFAYAGRVHNNHNHLMERYEGMDGIKTGYIRTSGFNLVASAVQNGQRLIGVIFGGKSAASRDVQMEKLLNASFARAQGREVRADDEDGEGDAVEAPRDQTLPLPTKPAPVLAGARAAAAARGSADEAPAVYGIQIGAYSSADDGRQAMQSIGQRLGPYLAEARPLLEPVTQDTGTVVYRARFMGLTEKNARALCAHLVKQSQACWLVVPAAPAQP